MGCIPVKKVIPSQTHNLCLYRQNAKTTQVDILAYFSKGGPVTIGCFPVGNILKEKSKADKCTSIRNILYMLEHAVCIYK